MTLPALHGIIPAVITPFREDESIDFAAWQTIIDALIAAGVHGLLITGGQGEFFSLTEEERLVALRFSRQHAAGRVPIYGNVGCVTTRATIHLAQKAEAEGVEYLVVITPYYLKPNTAELVEHYVQICRSVRIPVLAYNIPERTGIDLPMSATKQIAEACDNFAGLKDSTGKLDEMPALVGIGKDRPFSVFIGRDHMILAGLKLGCAGAVTACSNVAAPAFVRLYNAFRGGDLDQAARFQAIVEPLRQAFGWHTFPSVVKEAMKMSGLPAGPCRRPVGPMPEEVKGKLRQIVEKLRQDDCLLKLA